MPYDSSIAPDLLFPLTKWYNMQCILCRNTFTHHVKKLSSTARRRRSWQLTGTLRNGSEHYTSLKSSHSTAMKQQTSCMVPANVLHLLNLMKLITTILSGSCNRRVFHNRQVGCIQLMRPITFQTRVFLCHLHYVKIAHSYRHSEMRIDKCLK